MKANQPSRIQRLLTGIATAVIVVSLASSAGAQQKAGGSKVGEFAFGAAMGLQADTPDGAAFALGLYGDYFLTRELSVGPLLQMGVTNDLFQTGVSAQAKYFLDIADIPKLKPNVQAGLGIIHADLDRRGGKESDTSYLIPFGIGAEYKLKDSVSLDTTFLFNITNLDVRDEKFFVTWLVGLKF